MLYELALTLEETRWKLHKNAMCYFEQILENAPSK